MPGRSGISYWHTTIFRTPLTNRFGDRFPQANGVESILREALSKHPN
jgi:hypothetical protein